MAGSRWGDPVPEAPPRPRKRKSRWGDAVPDPPAAAPGRQLVLPPGLAGTGSNPNRGALVLPGQYANQAELQRRLDEVNHRLNSNDFADRRPAHERSPSPPPEYDGNGVRINTREERVRRGLEKDRQDLIGQLARSSSSYKAPSGLRQEFKKKIYVPVKQFPGYNFIGLIIGPRGNTQKRMERETGAKIALRGKGSVKEGRTSTPSDLEHEELHVVVTCDNQEGLDRACEMVEQLLVPTDDSQNQHKRMQLRELAELNGTLRSDEYWQMRRDEENATDVYKLPDQVKQAADEQYKRDVARFTGEDPSKLDSEYQNFLDEVGGRQAPPPPRGSGSNNPNLAPLGGGRPGLGGPGLGSTGGGGGGYRGRNESREIDEANLYVGFIPRSMREPDLRSLFETYGAVVEARIITDRNTGEPRGFGFVKFADKEAAKTIKTW